MDKKSQNQLHYVNNVSVPLSTLTNQFSITIFCLADAINFEQFDCLADAINFEQFDWCAISEKIAEIL